MPDEPVPYSLEPSLTPDQQLVLSFLAEGRSIHAAATEAGIHRNTIRNWRRSSPAFDREFGFATRERAAVWHEQTIYLAPRAATVLYELLTEPGTSDALKLRAALAVLKIASEPIVHVEENLESCTIVHNANEEMQAQRQDAEPETPITFQSETPGSAMKPIVVNSLLQSLPDQNCPIPPNLSPSAT